MKNCDPPLLFRSLLKKNIVIFSLLLCLLVLAGAHTNAYAATTQRTFCQVILQKAISQEAFSPASSSSCSAQPLASPKDAIPLITLYSQPGFQGKTITYYGYQGPCDDEGYHISYTGGLWDHIVSGFKAGPTCPGVRLWAERNMQGDCRSYQSEKADIAPDGIANNVKSIQVSAKPFDCSGKLPAPAPAPAPAPPPSIAPSACSGDQAFLVRVGTTHGTFCFDLLGISKTPIQNVTYICTAAASTVYNSAGTTAAYTIQYKTEFPGISQELPPGSQTSYGAFTSDYTLMSLEVKGSNILGKGTAAPCL